MYQQSYNSQSAFEKILRFALWLFTDSRIADCYKNWGTDYLTCERMM